MVDSLLAELLYLRIRSKPCSAPKEAVTTELSASDYATAKAAGFNMAQFSIAPVRYLRS